MSKTNSLSRSVKVTCLKMVRAYVSGDTIIHPMWLSHLLNPAQILFGFSLTLKSVFRIGLNRDKQKDIITVSAQICYHSPSLTDYIDTNSRYTALAVPRPESSWRHYRTHRTAGHTISLIFSHLHIPYAATTLCKVRL